MRRLADRERIRSFLRALGQAARRPARVYLAGGATAVLLGWRGSTIDIDMKLVPDHEELLRAIAALKERLELNVELATPDGFIPVRPGWEGRSRFAAQEGPLAVYHFDLVAQALAKVHRGHRQDREDVAAMVQRGLVDPAEARAAFAAIEAELYRYPAIDPPTFRRAVEAAFGPPHPGRG